MTAHRHTLLGLFFVTVIGVLSWFTLFKTDFSLLSERGSLTVHFAEAGGLREGDTVLVAGMRWGKIDSLSFDPSSDLDRRVTVRVSIDEPVELFNDHKIRIEDATVLGGKRLSIEPGLPSSGSFPESELLFGDVAPNVMEALGEVVSSNKDSLTSILTNLEQMVSDVQGGEGVLTQLLYNKDMADNLSAAVSSVSATFDNAEVLTTAMRAGEGTLGQLIYDDQLFGQIQSIATNLDEFLTTGRELVDEVAAGQGTVGALLKDEQMSQDLKDAIARLKDIATEVNEGRGTLGQLVADGTIGDNIKKITTELAEGKGTLGKLIAEDEVYENLRTIGQDLADASAALREGEGTIGKLIYDDQLYDELERALTVLTGTLEEAREAAPISTFLNTLFLGF